MKKRLVSIILTVFLVLSMMPFAAFADNAIVCPACGGSVTKQERRLLTAHDDFYKCDKCGKWAWVNKLGSLSLFSVGDQQILDAADSSAIINFSFNNGHLIPAEKAPSGIGRKDLPGYADDKGAALVDKDGQPTTTYTMLLDGYDTTVGVDTVYLHSESNNGSWYYQNLGSFSGKGGNLSVYSYYDVSGGSNQRLLVSLSYYYIAPVTGYYTLNPFGVDVRSCMRTNEGSYCGGTLGSFYGYYSFCKGLDTSKSKQFAYFTASEPTDNFQHFNVPQDTYFFTKGDLIFLDLYFPSQTFLSDTYTYHSLSIKSETPTLTV